MLEQRIQDIISKPLEVLGFDVVQVRWLSANKYNTLQVLADRKDGERLSVGDCESISRNISAILDVENLINDRYNLEVSSPGIDRPLVKLSDFTKYKGFIAKLQLRNGVRLEGTEFIRRKLKATIIDVTGNGIIKLETDDKHFTETDFDNIESAKLVLTDELIKAKL